MWLKLGKLGESLCLRNGPAHWWPPSPVILFVQQSRSELKESETFRQIMNSHQSTSMVQILVDLISSWQLRMSLHC
jgi:hypothetical protein